MILCNGLAFPWRGYRAIDGGFRNNCPVSSLCASMQSTDKDEEEPMHKENKRLIVKLDCNWISEMPLWRKLFHVVYAPSDISKKMLLEGTKDMLSILASGDSELNGITIIK